MTDEAKALVANLRDEDSYYRIQEKHWCIDGEELERQRLAAADLIETQAREIERLRAVLRHIARTKIEMVKADHANITLPFELPYFSAQQCWEMANEALGDNHD